MNQSVSHVTADFADLADLNGTCFWGSVHRQDRQDSGFGVRDGLADGYAHAQQNRQLPRRCVISADNIDYANQWHAQSPALTSARKRAAELDLSELSAAGAGLITVVVAATGAKAVVEVGTGVGATGLAVFAGIAADGVLTTIDADGHHQAAAKDAFRLAGHDSGRARLITGSAAEVLPRLADGAYDVVVINEVGSDPELFLAQARRLLRTGGTVIITDAIRTGRGATQAIRDDEEFISTLTPVDNGMLVAVKQESGE